jgi:hypothetical protein
VAEFMFRLLQLLRAVGVHTGLFGLKFGHACDLIACLSGVPAPWALPSTLDSWHACDLIACLSGLYTMDSSINP